LKNTRLPFGRLTALIFAEGLRCACHASLRRTNKYASFFMTSRALHPGIFEKPVKLFENRRLA
jgi:hypothetical protein